MFLYLRAESKQSIVTTAGHDLKTVFWISHISKYLRIILLLSIGIIISIIIAHPYQLWSDIEIKKDGIDIVVVMDVSGSMDFTDFEPSRIELAKTTLQSFINKISSDRVGLIVFSGKPISSQPLSFDYAIIDETIQHLSTDIIDQNIPWLSGTNIGDALLLSKGLFDEAEREKVVILITDGDANSGADPALAAQLLKKDDITIYPIWIWKDTPSEVVINNGFFQQRQTIPALNTSVLQSVADQTWWVFFRAWDSSTLRAIFEKLQELQTSEISSNITQYKSDYFRPFNILLLILLCLLSFIELIYPKCK